MTKRYGDPAGRYELLVIYTSGEARSFTYNDLDQLAYPWQKIQEYEGDDVESAAIHDLEEGCTLHVLQ